MKAREIMTRDVVCVPPDFSMRRAYNMMRKLRVRHLPVVVDERLLGIVSDRDILPHTREGQIDLDRPVRDVMTESPIVAEPRAPISRVAELMLEYKIDSIPIVKGHTFIGLLTSTDLLTLLLPPREEIAEPIPFAFNLLNPETAQRLAG